MTIAAVVRGASPTPGSPTRRAPSSWTPRLVVQGAPSPHAPVTLAITHAQPFALAQLVIGFGQANVPFEGGTMVPVPTVLLPLPTVDAARPAGFAATNGVASTAQ